MQPEGGGATIDRRAQRLGADRAAGVADEANRGHGLCHRLAGLFDRRVGDAEQGGLRFSAGLSGIGATGEGRIDALGARGAVDRATHAARSDDRERRDIGFVSVHFPFQFPHARYQTVVLLSVRPGPA